jgi:DNA polymerase-3 subunit beta
VIVPRKTITELTKLLSDSDEPLEISIGEAQIGFVFGHTTFISKLIDGKFPDYDRVIPTGLRHKIEIPRQSLHASLSRVAIMTTDKFRGVRVVLKNNLLQVISANSEQEEAEDEIEIAYDGEELDIGFNVIYLREVLDNLAGETIYWHFNDGNSSSLITEPDNEHFKYVVMPMRI